MGALKQDSQLGWVCATVTQITPRYQIMCTDLVTLLTVTVDVLGNRSGKVTVGAANES